MMSEVASGSNANQAIDAAGRLEGKSSELSAPIDPTSPPTPSGSLGSQLPANSLPTNLFSAGPSADLPPVAPPIAPPADRSAEAFHQLTTRLESLSGTVRELTGQVADLRDDLKRGSDDKSRDSVLKDLHEQLQEARAGVHWKILRVVLTELVKLYDELTRLSATPPADPQAFVGVLDSLRQDVEDILDRQGFVRFEHGGDQFDGKRQQPVGTTEAPTPDLVGVIAKRVAPGFASDERVLRPEKVVVYANPKTNSAK